MNTPSSSPTGRIARIGFYGGTFDPPHVGHWLAAVDALERLALDRLVFIPAAMNPLKVGRAVTPGADRVAMLQHLVHGDTRFAVDGCEVERAGPSYTVDTLRALAARYPDAERIWLLGEDCIPDLPRWKDVGRLPDLATFAVLARPTTAGDTRPCAPIPLHWLPTRAVTMSSTEIRERVRQGRSIRGFVADRVATHIAQRGLYTRD